MKTALAILLTFSLVACQKEIQLYRDPKTGQTPVELPPVEPEPQPEPEPKDTIYREDPTHDVVMSEFAPMLWEKRQYKVTEYYCTKRNLWNELSSWIKDDTYTFHESGKGWVSAGQTQHPTNSFETIQKGWKVYGENGVAKFNWLDSNYNETKYTIAAYKPEESFTVSIMANDSSKVFLTFSLIGKEQ